MLTSTITLIYAYHYYSLFINIWGVRWGCKFKHFDRDIVTLSEIKKNYRFCSRLDFQGYCQIITRNFHDFSMTFQDILLIFHDFSTCGILANFTKCTTVNYLYGMGGGGGGCAEIIQLNPVESHIQETVFLKYPIVLEQ